jgi:hypothetical protein
MDRKRTSVSFRLLIRRRDLLLEELRIVAPDLVAELEFTLDELERHEHNGLDGQP